MEMLSRIVTPEGIRHITVLPGWTARELIDQNTDVEIRPYVVAFNHGVPILDPDTFHVQDGDNLILCLVPAGGGGGRKGTLGAILSIAVSVFAWQMAPMMTASMFGEAAALNTLGGATMLTNAVGAGISFVGHALLSALIRPPSIKSTPSKQGGQTYSFGGVSNAASPYGAVPRLYGRHRIFPKIAANPLVHNVGKHGTITALYDFGLGNINITDLKIGDSPATVYDPEIHIHQNSLCQTMVYMPSRVGYDTMNYNLDDGVPLILNTKQNVMGAAIDISFPQGMFVVDNQGTSQGSRSTRVQLLVQYRAVGSATWIPVPLSAYNNDGATTINQFLVTPDTTVQATASCSRGTFTFVPSIPPGNMKNPGNVDLRDGRSVRTYQEWGSIPGGSTIGGTTSGYVGPRYVVVPPDWIWGNPAAVGQPPYPLGGTFTTNARWVTPYSFTPAVYTDYVELKGRVEQPFTLNVLLDFPVDGNYELYIERIGNPGGSTSWDRFTDSVVTLVKSFQKGNVVNLDRRHTMLEMRLKATNKISGTVQNLSAIGISVIRTTTDGVNFVYAESRNPAWIAIDLLTSESNARPVPDNMIDWASWIALANYCDQPVTRIVNGVAVTQPRHQADFVLDSFTTAKELLESLLSGCRASLRIDGAGRYSVLIDIKKTVPRQIITPENSWGFSGSRTFTDEIHALRVQFIDGNRADGTNGSWNPGEVICYADSYDAATAKPENIEEMQTFGLTDYAAAWAFGRYQLAQGIIRNEQFAVTMGIDNLVCARGDLVWVAHDVPQIGGVAGRVTSITGRDITISTPVSVAPTHYSVRRIDGTVHTGRIHSANPDGSLTLDSAAGINIDDLIVVGMTNRVTQPYLVQQITPDRDLTATLTLVKYDEDVYTADTAPLPDWDPGFGDGLINSTDLNIVNLMSEQSLRYKNRYPYNEFVLTWDVTGFNYSYADIYATYSNGERVLIGSSPGRRYVVDVDHIADPEKLGFVKFEAVPVSLTGMEGVGDSFTAEVVRDNTPPKTPTGFGVNVQDMMIAIFWDMNSEVDIDHYILRYSPDPVGGTWNASQLIGEFAYNVNRTAVGARTGKYMLVAVDTSGNQSEFAWQRTTVETLPSIDILRTVNDQLAGWPGSHGGTYTDGIKVALEGNWGEVSELGYYQLDGMVDLGHVTEGRISSKLRAHGATENDVIANWIPIAMARPLASAQSSDWNVSLEYRTIDDVIVIAQWVPLNGALATPIAGNLTGRWSPWRPVEVSDFVARYLQFRIKLESYDPFTRPIVDDGLIEIDVAERTWGSKDVAVPAAGMRILFDPPFIGLEAIAVTIDGTGTAHALRSWISNKNNYGFDVSLYDSSDVAVSGQIDVMALGYGAIRTTSL